MANDGIERLIPLDVSDWPDELDHLKHEFFGGANVYKVMAHHPRLLKAWTNLRQHIVVDTSLGLERSEVAILRAAVRTGSPYEWAHHVLRARRLGFSDERLAALSGDLENVTPADRSIAAAVDDLIGTARLSPQTLRDLHAKVGPEGVLDLMATVGFYSTLAFILNSFEIELEEDVMTALSEHPLPL